MKTVYLVKKAISMYSYLIWTPINKISFLLNGVRFGKNLKCRGKVFTVFHSEKSKLVLGNSVFINSGNKQNPIGCGDQTYFQLFDKGEIVIGDNVGISNAAFSCYERIEIEKNAFIGAGCKFFDNDFHPIEYQKRVFTNEKPKSAPIMIREGAFVGGSTFVLKGVTIGKHSVVGAGSVVTKSIPDDEIWAGNPARFIKKVPS